VTLGATTDSLESIAAASLRRLATSSNSGAVSSRTTSRSFVATIEGGRVAQRADEQFDLVTALER
jgi:hypothetical protein